MQSDEFLYVCSCTIVLSMNYDIMSVLDVARLATVISRSYYYTCTNDTNFASRIVYYIITILL